jgi:aryl-alcohol dehydrogenase-like predicted oxidoreductase
MTVPAGQVLRLTDSMAVGRLGYGAMQLPGPGVWGPPQDHDTALAVLRRAVELGVTHIDTSDFYGPHVANDLIKEALHPYPDPPTGWHGCRFPLVRRHRMRNVTGKPVMGL